MMKFLKLFVGGKIILVIGLFILISVLGLFWKIKLQKEEKEIHYHAGFLVYLDGKRQDFSASKYMDIEPCSKNPAMQVREDDQKEKAHLHDRAGDVVHVHREGAVWGDLFKNIGYSFPRDKKVDVFVNGKTAENILTHPIKPDDSIIIVVGDSRSVDLSHYVTKEHIKEIEKKSETCGS